MTGELDENKTRELATKFADMSETEQLQVTPEELIELIRETVSELTPALEKAAEAIADNTPLKMSRQQKVYDYLIGLLNTYECNITEMGEHAGLGLNSSHPATLQRVGGGWTLYVLKESAMSRGSAYSIKELVHEFGALVLLQKMIKKLGLDEKNLPKVAELKAQLHLNDGVFATHIIDAVLAEITKEQQQKG